MPHRPLQNVVQEKGHRDLISDEGHITKGGDGAAKFESVANGIRRHLVYPCLRNGFPRDRKVRKLCGVCSVVFLWKPPWTRDVSRQLPLMAWRR